MGYKNIEELENEYHIKFKKLNKRNVGTFALLATTITLFAYFTLGMNHVNNEINGPQNPVPVYNYEQKIHAPNGEMIVSQYGDNINEDYSYHIKKYSYAGISNDDAQLIRLQDYEISRLNIELIDNIMNNTTDIETLNGAMLVDDQYITIPKTDTNLNYTTIDEPRVRTSIHNYRKKNEQENHRDTLNTIAFNLGCGGLAGFLCFVIHITRKPKTDKLKEEVKTLKRKIGIN
jgi:hypothetical protein